MFFSGVKKVICDDDMDTLFEIGLGEELGLLGEDLCGACEVEFTKDADNVWCLSKVKSTTDFFYYYM